MKRTHSGPLVALPVALLWAACSPGVDPPVPATGLAWELALDRGAALDVAVDPAGARVASVSSNDRLRLHDAGDGAVLAEARGHRRGITSVAFAPDGARLATTGPDRTVRLWSADGLVEERAWSRLERPPLEAAFDGERVVAVTMAGAVRAWDADTGEERVRREGPALRGVMALALSDDGERLAWAADGGRLRVWSTRDGARLADGRIDGLGFVAVVALAPDGETMAIGARDAGWLVIVDLGTDRAVRCEDLDAPPRSLAFDGEGRRLACATTSGEVVLFGARDGRRLARLAAAEEAEGAPTDMLEGRAPRRLAFDPAGARLFAAGPEGRLRAWHVGGVVALERGDPIAGPAPVGTLPRLEVEEGVLDLQRLAVPGYDPPELRPEAGALPREAFPDAILALDGAEITTAGYPLAAALEDGETRTFLLSRFPPGCCFGAVPVLDEWIEVTAPAGTPPLVPDRAVNVTGVLEVGEVLDETGFALSLYRMVASRVEPR